MKRWIAATALILVSAGEAQAAKPLDVGYEWRFAMAFDALPSSHGSAYSYIKLEVRKGASCGVRVHYDRGPWLALPSQRATAKQPVLLWYWTGPGFNPMSKVYPKGTIVAACRFEGKHMSQAQRFGIHD